MSKDSKLKKAILVVAVVCFLAAFICGLVQPDVLTKSLPTEIDDLAEARGVPVQREGSFEYMAVQDNSSKEMGGQIGALSKKYAEANLVDMAYAKHVTIHYTVKEHITTLEKFYWICAEGMCFYWSEEQPLPGDYDVGGFNASQVVLEKDMGSMIWNSFWIGVLGGLCAWFFILALVGDG